MDLMDRFVADCGDVSTGTYFSPDPSVVCSLCTAFCKGGKMFLMILDREGRNKAKHLVSDEKISGYSAGGPAGVLARNAPQTFRSGPRASASLVLGSLPVPVLPARSAGQHPPGLGAGQALESLSLAPGALAGSDNLDNLDSLKRPEQPLQAEIRLVGGRTAYSRGLGCRAAASPPASLPRACLCLVPLPLQAPGRGHGKKVTQRTGVSTSFSCRPQGRAPRPRACSRAA